MEASTQSETLQQVLDRVDQINKGQLTLKSLELKEASPYLKYQVLSNQRCLQNTLKGQHNDSDLVSGVYEGGLKVWEGSIDLVHHIASQQSMFKDKRVLELGCGQGLPGIAALVYGGAA